jgi:hypothetical protein
MKKTTESFIVYTELELAEILYRFVYCLPLYTVGLTPPPVTRHAQRQCLRNAAGYEQHPQTRSIYLVSLIASIARHSLKLAGNV